MKKHYNAFKANRLSNALRITLIICLSAIVLMLVMYVSVGSNRKRIASFFGLNDSKISNNQNEEKSSKDIGLSQSPVVNANMQVRQLDRSDHLWGPIDAPVALIVYYDFECPFSAQFYETIKQAKAEFGNDLVVAARHFPLISHEQAIPAALASECAAQQDKFWEMYDLLYANAKSGKLSNENYQKDAEQLGLNGQAFEECLTKTTYKDKILSEKEEIKGLGVIGTPASFVNNQYIPGAIPYEDFSYPDGSAALGLRSLIQKKLNETK